jgi:hypothetical protein
MTGQEACTFGAGTEHPCSNPATVRYAGRPICEGHEALLTLGERADDLADALDYLQRWIRTAGRHGLACLRRALGGVRDGFAAELAELEAERRAIRERYSLPPSGDERLQAKQQRDEEPAREPESEAERLWQKHERRARSFTSAAVALEEEVDKLHGRLEEEVLPLLEKEAEEAEAEAHRLKEEFEL